MITVETRTVLHCKCERPECGHEWDSFRRDNKTGKLVSEKPKRCAKCKYLGWNREDRRRSDPFEFAPPDALAANGKVPQLRPKDLLDTLTAAQEILQLLIADLGPCDHAKKICVCQETEALVKVNRQIKTLAKLAGNGKPAKAAAAEKTQ